MCVDILLHEEITAEDLQMVGKLINDCEALNKASVQNVSAFMLAASNLDLLRLFLSTSCEDLGTGSVRCLYSF